MKKYKESGDGKRNGLERRRGAEKLLKTKKKARVKTMMIQQEQNINSRSAL